MDSRTQVITCAECGRTNDDSHHALKKCGACFESFYCSAICQKRHWAEHKPKCRAKVKANTVSAVFADHAQLDHTCEGCGKSQTPGEKNHSCPNCRSSYFCSDACWKKEYKTHKNVCNNLADAGFYGNVKDLSRFFKKSVQEICNGCNEPLYANAVTCPYCIGKLCSKICRKKHKCLVLAGATALQEDNLKLGVQTNLSQYMENDDHRNLRYGVDFTDVPLAVIRPLLPLIRSGEIVPDSHYAGSGCMLVPKVSAIWVHVAEMFLGGKGIDIKHAATALYKCYVEQLLAFQKFRKMAAKSQRNMCFDRAVVVSYKIDPEITHVINQIVMYTTRLQHIPAVSLTFTAQPQLKKKITSLLVKYFGKVDTLVLDRVRSVLEAILWMRSIPASCPDSSLYVEDDLQIILMSFVLDKSITQIVFDVSDVHDQDAARPRCEEVGKGEG